VKYGTKPQVGYRESTFILFPGQLESKRKGRNLKERKEAEEGGVWDREIHPIKLVTSASEEWNILYPLFHSLPGRGNRLKPIPKESH